MGESLASPKGSLLDDHLEAIARGAEPCSLRAAFVLYLEEVDKAAGESLRHSNCRLIMTVTCGVEIYYPPTTDVAAGWAVVTADLPAAGFVYIDFEAYVLPQPG